MPVDPATWEAEVGGLLEPGSFEATMSFCFLGDKARPRLKKKKELGSLKKV